MGPSDATPPRSAGAAPLEDVAHGEQPAGSLPEPNALVGGRYRLGARLGQGGMGTVFAAEDVRLGRSCAVKFMRRELAGDPDMRRRFGREARIAGQLGAENVVAVTDIGEHDGLPFLVMERLQGEDLRALLLRERQLPLPRAVDLAVQMCRGVESAHGRGVIHRDLNPKNIFITRHADGRDLVKVLDFGLATSTVPSSTAVTSTSGTLRGTLHYMAPEQLRGEQSQVRVDVYALGATAYEMLAGRVPFEASEAHVLMHRIMHDAPAPLEAVRPGLPRDVYLVIERALAREPQARFGSVAELAQALERASQRASWTADGETRPVPETDSDAAASASLPQARRRGWTRPGYWMLALVIALGCAWALQRASRTGPRAAAPQHGPAVRAQPAAVPASAARVPTAAPASTQPPPNPPVAVQPPKESVQPAARSAHPARARKSEPREPAARERAGELDRDNPYD